MGDNPRRNVQWMTQELLAAESHGQFSEDTEDLLARVDQLLEEDPEPPAFAQKPGKQTKGQRAAQAHIRHQFDESAAVLTKTRKQLRREEKLRKKAEKKASVNRSIGGLVVLAVVECIGILAILGWWLQ